MRIALVTETYFPEVNGVALTLERLVSGLLGKGDAVQLVRPRQPGSEGSSADRDDILVRGLSIPCYPALQLGVFSRGRLLRAWRRDRPDIVHVATEGPLGWSAVSAARRLRIPLVSSYHTNFDQYGAHYGVGWLQRAVLGSLRTFHNLTHATFVPTDPLRTRLAEFGFRNLRILGRGVDTARFTPARRSTDMRRSWEVDDDSLVCLYVGRIASEKNLPLAIAAFTQIRNRQPRTRFVLVGDGPLRSKLQEKHPELLFVGAQGGETLAASYASGDLFLFPSLTETFGNVITEAMASGLPIVSFQNGAAAQHLRHETSGLLADIKCPSQFVAYAVRASQNAIFRHELGYAARESALRLGWEEITDQYRRDLLMIAQLSTCRRVSVRKEFATLNGTLESRLAD